MAEHSRGFQAFSQRVVANMRRAPDRTAVASGDTTWTYARLDRESASMAARLRALGVGPGARVGSVFGKSPQFVAAFLACLRADMTFVPIDPMHGEAFVERVMAAAELDAVLAPAGTLPWRSRPLVTAETALPDAVRFESPWVESRRHPAMIIFTSGSTGVPKGVVVTEANITHYVWSLCGVLGWREHDEPRAFGYVSSVGADLGNTSLFGALWLGGSVHLAHDDIVRDPAWFRSWIESSRLSVLKITPSHFRALLGDRAEGLELGCGLETLILGGERLDTELVRRILAAGLAQRVVNHYGPTETTVGVLCSVWDRTSIQGLAAESVPIGRPFGSTHVELVDADGTPSDEVGELLLGGPSVTRGYFGNPEQTAARFVPRPAPDGTTTTMYRTGDRCRRDGDGRLVFEGRVDRQVKISGFRIEPEAVESVLLGHPAVVRAVVWGEQSTAGDLLVSVIETSEDVTDESLRDAIRARLPKAAVPSVFQRVERIPLNANGKVDVARAKLLLPRARAPVAPDHVDAAGAPASSRAATRKLVEGTLAELLPAGRVEPSRSFFEQGGDSLQAIMAINALQRTGLPIEASAFFAARSIDALVEEVWRRADGDVPIHAASRPTELRPTAIQRWFAAHFPERPKWWNQAIALRCTGIDDASLLHDAILAVLRQHGALWLRHDADGIEALGPDAVASLPHWRVDVEGATQRRAEIARLAPLLHQSIDPERGRMFAFAVIAEPSRREAYVLAVAHHLVIDGLSWRILADEWCTSFIARREGTSAGQASPELVVHETSPGDASPGAGVDATPAALQPTGDRLPLDEQGANTEGSAASVTVVFGPAATAVLADEPALLDTWILACFADAVLAWAELDAVWVDVEHHGRAWKNSSPELTRAVGWFTSIAPVRFERRDGLEGAALKTSELFERLRDDPHFYSAQHLSARAASPGGPITHGNPQIVFNDLGDFSSPVLAKAGWSFDDHDIGPTRSPESDRLYTLKVTGRRHEGRLLVEIGYSRALHRASSIQRLALGFRERLLETIRSFARVSDDDAVTTLLHEERSSSGLMVFRPVGLELSSKPEPGRVVESLRMPTGVLVTGATGFLGSHVVAELLERTDGLVWCLVRAEHLDGAARRLRASLAHHRPELEQALLTRVRPILGDVVAAGLGLDPEERAKLVASISDIFHLAANVTLFASEELLDRVNVGGTANVIELLGACRGARLHHVSTLSVCGANPDSTTKSFGEDDFAYGQGFLSPYEKSKLEAEALVRSFRDGGGRATIHRTGNVAADSRTGVFQRNIGDNRLYQTWRAFVRLGCAPSGLEPMRLSCVDVVAKGIVCLALGPEQPNATFHVETPHEVSIASLFEAFGAEGLEITTVAPEHFERLVRQRDEAGDPAAALAKLWVIDRGRRPRNVRVDCTRTLGQLARLGVKVPRPSAAWLRALVRHCIDVGFVERVTKPRDDHRVTSRPPAPAIGAP